VEGRRPTKGNSLGKTKGRTQDRETLQQNLERVRKAVANDKERQLTTLWHHVYNVDHLRATFFQLRKAAAPGVDGVTWQTYAENLEENLQDLSERLRKGAYRAKPVRRTYIPKPDGRMRPLGIPTLEDKLVQGLTKTVLEQVYEQEFCGFSYGCRPGRSPHGALDAALPPFGGRLVPGNKRALLAGE
jgi:RNA-directed DNA polymerase